MVDAVKTCGTCKHWRSPLPNLGDHGAKVFSHQEGAGQCRKYAAGRGGVHRVAHHAYSDSWGWTMDFDGCDEDWSPKVGPAIGAGLAGGVKLLLEAATYTGTIPNPPRAGEGVDPATTVVTGEDLGHADEGE